MRDVNHALDRIGEISGLSTLAWSADGHVELVFDKSVSVTLVKVDDTALELVSWLDLELPEGEAGLRALLRANHVGDATGAGRLALDPAGDLPMLCRRIDVDLFDDRSIETALLDFVRHVTFWQSEAAADLLGASAAPAAERAPEADPSAFILRA